MKDRKHLSSQIQEAKERRGRYSVSTSEMTHLLDGLRTVAAAANDSSTMTDFIPIRLATFIEVAVRNGIREIVDAGPPYSDREKTFDKLIKFDYLLANAIHGNQISLGDLVANSIPTSSLAHIISVLSVLLGEGFQQNLVSIDNRGETFFNNKREPIIDNAASVFASVGEIFEVRHILVHELPRQRPYRVRQLQSYIDSAQKFLLALEELIARELHGDYPVTQQQMNAAAHACLREARAKLASLIWRARSTTDLNKRAFFISQKTWQKFCDAEARLHASLVEGGSMWPLLYYSACTELVEERVKQVRWWIDRDEAEF